MFTFTHLADVVRQFGFITKCVNVERFYHSKEKVGGGSPVSTFKLTLRGRPTPEALLEAAFDLVLEERRTEALYFGLGWEIVLVLGVKCRALHMPGRHTLPQNFFICFETSLSCPG